MAKKQYIFFLLLILTFFLHNCQNCDSAGSANTSSIKVGFYTLDENNNLIADTSMVEQITASESDSIFYDRNTDTTTHIISLELPPAKDSVSYFFRNNTDTYQLTVSFDRQIAIKKPDCGLEDRISNLTLLNHTFDSLLIENTSLDLAHDTLVNFLIIQ